MILLLRVRTPFKKHAVFKFTMMSSMRPIGMSIFVAKEGMSVFRLISKTRWIGKMKSKNILNAICRRSQISLNREDGLNGGNTAPRRFKNLFSSY